MKFYTVAVAFCLAAPAAALNGGYMNSISGGSNAKPSVKPAYKPQGASSPPANGSYLNNVATPAAVNSYGTPASAQASSYLEQMGGGNVARSTSGPKTSYAPTKRNVVQKSGGAGFGSYLDKVAGSAPSTYSAQPAAPVANSAPTAASYLQQMGGAASRGSSSGPKNSYAPTKSTVVQKSGGAGFGSYLDKVAGSAPSSYIAPPSSPTVTSPPSYQQLGGSTTYGSSSAPKKSYAPTKSNVAQKSGGTGFGSYLDKVAGSAPSSYSTTPVTQSVPSGSYQQQMGGSSHRPPSGPKNSYAPTKSNVVQKSGGTGFGSYLDKVAGSGPTSIQSGYGAPPGPEEPSFSIPAAPTAASYLERMGGGSAGAPPSARKTSYAPTQSSWKR